MEVPTEVALLVGESRTIPLTGAGSAGYGWHLSVVGDSIEARLGPLAGDVPPTDLMPHGGSIAQALFLVGRIPGQAAISLELRRRSANTPRESHRIAAIVSE